MEEDKNLEETNDSVDTEPEEMTELNSDTPEDDQENESEDDGIDLTNEDEGKSGHDIRHQK